MGYTYRKDHLFWTAIYNESLFIWHSNLDDGSNSIPLIDTGASPTQYGKKIYAIYHVATAAGDMQFINCFVCS